MSLITHYFWQLVMKWIQSLSNSFKLPDSEKPLYFFLSFLVRNITSLVNFTWFVCRGVHFVHSIAIVIRVYVRNFSEAINSETTWQLWISLHYCFIFSVNVKYPIWKNSRCCVMIFFFISFMKSLGKIFFNNCLHTDTYWSKIYLIYLTYQFDMLLFANTRKCIFEYNLFKYLQTMCLQQQLIFKLSSMQIALIFCLHIIKIHTIQCFGEKIESMQTI